MTQSTVLAWRFNDAKFAVVVRRDPKLVAALVKASGAKNMCISGHEFQCLLPIADLHRYQKLLGLTASQLVTLSNGSRLVEAR